MGLTPPRIAHLASRSCKGRICGRGHRPIGNFLITVAATRSRSYECFSIGKRPAKNATTRRRVKPVALSWYYQFCLPYHDTLALITSLGLISWLDKVGNKVSWLSCSYGVALAFSLRDLKHTSPISIHKPLQIFENTFLFSAAAWPQLEFPLVYIIECYYVFFWLSCSIRSQFGKRLSTYQRCSISREMCLQPDAREKAPHERQQRRLYRPLLTETIVETSTLLVHVLTMPKERLTEVISTCSHSDCL